MRCRNCSKFVSMENGEPELECKASLDKNVVSLTITGRHTRNCADCGTELKDVDISEKADLPPVEEWDSFKALDEAGQKKLAAALKEGTADVEAECDAGEAEESGGGRYAKNMIVVRANCTVTVSADDGAVEAVREHEVVVENAAGNYNECC